MRILGRFLSLVLMAAGVAIAIPAFITWAELIFSGDIFEGVGFAAEAMPTFVQFVVGGLVLAAGQGLWRAVNHNSSGNTIFHSPSFSRDTNYVNNYDVQSKVASVGPNARLHDVNLNHIEDSPYATATMHVEQPYVSQPYTSSDRKVLEEVTTTIQRLLSELDKRNPEATFIEKQNYVTASIPLTTRQRTFGALQAGGKAALDEFLKNPYVNVAVAIIEGWQKPE